MSEKETARVSSKLKGKNKIFNINGKGIEIQNNKREKSYICDGIFSRMFTAFNTPSSIKKLFITSIEIYE